MPRTKKVHRRHRRARKAGPYGKQLSFYKAKRYAMYRSPRTIMPQEYVTNLRYGISFNTIVATSTNYSLCTLKSDPYDVNAALGNTAMPGFTEFAGFYARYRTLRFGYNITFVNNESFPVTVTALLSPQIPGTTTNISTVGNPLSKSLTLSGLDGQPKGTLKGNYSIAAINGSRNSLFADDWEGDTGGNGLGFSTLQRVMYLSCFANSYAPCTDGVFKTIVITLTVQFSQPRWLAV